MERIPAKPVQAFVTAGHAIIAIVGHPSGMRRVKS